MVESLFLSKFFLRGIWHKRCQEFFSYSVRHHHIQHTNPVIIIAHFRIVELYVSSMVLWFVLDFFDIEDHELHISIINHPNGRFGLVWCEYLNVYVRHTCIDTYIHTYIERDAQGLPPKYWIMDLPPISYIICGQSNFLKLFLQPQWLNLFQ